MTPSQNSPGPVLVCLTLRQYGPWSHCLRDLRQHTIKSVLPGCLEGGLGEFLVLTTIACERYSVGGNRGHVGAFKPSSKR